MEHWQKLQRGEKVTKTALIVVGNVLNTEYERSKLYDPAFTTEFRKGKRGMSTVYVVGLGPEQETDGGQSGEDTGGVSCDPWIYGIY